MPAFVDYFGQFYRTFRRQNLNSITSKIKASKAVKVSVFCPSLLIKIKVKAGFPGNMAAPTDEYWQTRGAVWILFTL